MNMIVVDDPKGKSNMKVLTSDRARKAGAVDPDRQITNEEFRQRIQSQNGQNKGKEVSKPRVTTTILLNKWQRERERHQRWKYYEEQEFMEEQRRYKEEIPKRTRIYKETRPVSLGMFIFRHYWNEGLKLPARNNCHECSDQYLWYRQSRVNRRSVHERLGAQFHEDNRRLKISSSKNQQGKRFADQDWVHYGDHKEEEEFHEYMWQRGQWCPPGLTISQNGECNI
jgi:hypothetical protein